MRATQIASLSALIVSSVAHPHHQSSEHALQGRQVASGGNLERFRPQQRAEYVNATVVESDLTDPSSNSSIVARQGGYVAVAAALVRATHPDAEFRQLEDNHVSSSGVGHVYFKQTLFGFDIDDADFNVNVRPDGTVFSYGDSFYTGPLPSEAPSVPQLLEPAAAVTGVVDTLALPIEPSEGEIIADGARFTVEGLSGVESAPQGHLVYYRSGDSLVPAWRVETDISDAWLTSYIQADGSNNVIAVTDYVADASYEVFEWPLVSPAGNRRSIQVDPQDTVASRLGWHADSNQRFISTRGNNAIAQINADGDSEHLSEPRPENAQLNFEAPFDVAWEPAQYINASIIQLFYTANKFRDVIYRLGFTEAAGNFQTSNFGNGGIGGDSVILNTQDGSGTNNANFATPPDGQQGRMRMYRFTRSTPGRDSSFDAGVVIHEYTHGLTNRMTGGPANSRCLAVLESGGMGEGWSDFFATAIRVRGSDTRAADYPVGEYVFNNPAGIRAVVYSTSLQTNPYTYSRLNSLTLVHQFGTVWCSILYEVMWNLIDARGNTDAEVPELDGSGVPRDGRYLAMKLVLDGLALQPCNPTFLQARDAILDADRALTDGSNLCELWTGFAKRGLGQGAVRNGQTYTDSFVVPAGVC